MLIMVDLLKMSGVLDNGSKVLTFSHSLLKIRALVTETVTEAMSTGILIGKLEAALRIHRYRYAIINSRNPMLR